LSETFPQSPKRGIKAPQVPPPNTHPPVARASPLRTYARNQGRSPPRSARPPCRTKGAPLLVGTPLA